MEPVVLLLLLICLLASLAPCPETVAVDGEDTAAKWGRGLEPEGPRERARELAAGRIARANMAREEIEGMENLTGGQLWVRRRSRILNAPLQECNDRLFMAML